MLPNSIKNVLRDARDGLKDAVTPDRWPTSTTEALEDTFLVLLTPRNSGSTALAKFICQSESVITLNERDCEGQWLIPGMSDEDRWWPEKFVNYRSVAGVWEKKIAEERAKHLNAQYVFEKSPPNLVRSAQLFTIIPNHRVVVNNRDPYATISSQAGRYFSSQSTPQDRIDVVEHLARFWIFCSDFLYKGCQEQGYPTLSYEAFCERPKAAAEVFGLPPEQFSDEAGVRVKDYDVQPIRNMNERQIGKLSVTETAAISAILGTRTDLMSFFGYDLR